jgi:hypothetical protein
MSKKLFAAATAAALALTALVGVTPASANYTFGVTANGEISTAQGLNASSPLAINVPSQDVLRVDESTPGSDTASAQSVTASAIRLNIQASTTSAAVRVVTTGGVKVISETQYSTTADRKTATGVQDLSVTSSSTDGKVNVVIYTTSTTAGTVTVSQGGNSVVLNVKGVTRAGYAYKYAFTTTATANVSDTLDFSGSVTDAFGNKITGIASTPFTLTLFGSASAAATGDDAWTESTTDAGTYTFGVTTSATAGSGIVGLALTTAATKITALGTPTANAFFSFSTASLADQVTALTASVAALKADYNALAAKWNKRVASKTAPKKKVALK